MLKVLITAATATTEAAAPHELQRAYYARAAAHDGRVAKGPDVLHYFFAQTPRHTHPRTHTHTHARTHAHTHTHTPHPSPTPPSPPPRFLRRRAHTHAQIHTHTHALCSATTRTHARTNTTRVKLITRAWLCRRRSMVCARDNDTIYEIMFTVCQNQRR